MPTQEIVLYRALASRAIIALWMLEELGVSYRSKMVEGPAVSRSPQLRKLNPSGKVPALVAYSERLNARPAWERAAALNWPA